MNSNVDVPFPPRRRSAALGLMAGVLFAALAAPTAALAGPADPVAFSDAALESCVLDTLELPEGTPVTEADLAQLTNLSCRSMGISDIGPLVFATGLTRIDLADNSVSDLRPVSGLSSLGTLLLVDNQVSDVTPLSGLPALSDLYLNRNQVSDITPLASIPTLRALLIHSNQISDVTALAGLSNLGIVYVANNAIRDISPLGALPRLQTLDATLQQLPTVELSTGIPTPSPIVAENGELIPVRITAGDGVASGTDITWNTDGSGSAAWEYTYPIGTSRGQFSGVVGVNATTQPEVSLAGSPVDGVVGSAYSFDFALTGKPTAPQSTIVGGRLPAGVSLSADGKLTGTPTESGVFSFDIAVSNGAAEQTYSRTLTVAAAAVPPKEEEGGGVVDGGVIGGKVPGSGTLQLADSGAGAPHSGAWVTAVSLLALGGAAVAFARHGRQKRAGIRQR